MTPEDFWRAGDLFDLLRDLSDEEREARLDAECSGNAALRREVIRLLDGDRKADADQFLSRRAIEDASRLITLDPASDRPALAPGTRFGPYEVVSMIGAGGMGEVYRARDAKLNRDVAIKVLPASLAEDALYMARFEREAQVLASLNHPNIATVYGIEQGALLMEFVEGENLRGPLPLDEAIHVMRQIAAGLEAAHERGVVHRDLKPPNIKLTPAGVVKLLDFGLAKSAETPAAGAGHSNAPSSPKSASTSSPELSQAGLIMGTAAYMSPEQARAKPVDKRADIWAFGVVFYESLTGERPFAGKTTADTLTAVVRQAPDLGKLPQNTPPHIRNLIARCLRKDPLTRLRDIGEARIALEEGFVDQPRSTNHRKWIFGAAAALIVFAATLAFFWQRMSPRSTPSFRLAVPPPEHAGFSLVSLPALSPDGRYLAFATGSGRQARLWIRELNATQSREIPATEGTFDPFWSPDSRSVAFFVPGKLNRVAIDGGPVSTICDASDGRGGTWNRDDVIVFAPTFGSPLYRVPAGGGMPEPVGQLDESAGETSHVFPWFLPDGNHYLYTSRNANPAKNAIFVTDLKTNNRSRVVAVSSNAVYSPGYLLYIRSGSLMAQAFDAGRIRTTGEPFAVADQVGFLPGSLQGQFAASQTGLLGYYSGSNPLLSQLTWVDRNGKTLETIGDPDVMQAPALSPDGSTVVVDRLDPAAGTYDLWLFHLPDQAVSRFTFDTANDMFPVWSYDGRSILFSSDRRGKLGLYEKDASGPASEHLLLQMDGITLPTDGSGRDLLLFSNQAPQAQNSLFSLPLAPGAKPAPLVHSNASESHGRLSPDGHWLAYDSSEGGSTHIFVTTYPSAQGKWQVSAGATNGEGGSRPMWSHDGRELFYVSTVGNLMRVAIAAGAAFTHDRPAPLFATRMPPMSPFAVSQDGKRFLILNGIESDVTTPITLIVNWDGGLKK